MLWCDRSKQRAGGGRGYLDAPCRGLLVLIGPEQLPHVLEVLLQACGDGAHAVKEKLAAVSELWKDCGLVSLYLSWVQQTLVGIIKEVLSQDRQ
jgi:hypothetical protein